MSINLLNIRIIDNPTKFSNPFQFEIHLECVSPISDDLEWRLTYIGSAENEMCDQILDKIFLGPLVVGQFKFVFEAPAPDWTKIPEQDLLGVTVVLLTGHFKNQEFVRVGYYVNNEYEEKELQENPPAKFNLDKVVRCVLEDAKLGCPRVTQFPIQWEDTPNRELVQLPQPQADVLESANDINMAETENEDSEDEDGDDDDEGDEDDDDDEEEGETSDDQEMEDVN